MGRVGRLKERRVIRHAAGVALLPAAVRTPGDVAKDGDRDGCVSPDSVLTDIDTLTTAYRPRPPLRTKQILTVLGAVAVAVVAVLALLALVRDSGGGVEESTAVPASTTAGPDPTSAGTPLTSLPPRRAGLALPPPAPPPPPPSAERINPAPVVTRQNPRPRYVPPSQPDRKPEIGVTRAPISVAPTPRPGNGATPGDGPAQRRGGFFG